MEHVAQEQYVGTCIEKSWLIHLVETAPLIKDLKKKCIDNYHNYYSPQQTITTTDLVR